MKNNKALLDFFEANRKKLYLYIFKMTGVKEDAEDIFQDTFIKYARVYPDQQSPALLFTVAKSLFLDNVRRNRSTDEEPDENMMATDRSPEKVFFENREKDRIMRAMDSLSYDDREIMSMAGHDGLSYSEIASIKKMTESNVKVRVFRARIKLKNLLEAGNE